MNTIKITTSQNIELEYDLAGLGERIVARIVDLLIAAAYVLIIIFIIVYTNGVFTDRFLWVLIPAFMPVVFYDLLMEIFMNGQSVGKKVMHIKVVSLDGAQPSLGQYLIRWLFRLVDFSLSGSLCALITVAASTRKQRVGDMVAGTTLIKTLPKTHLNQTIYAPQPIPDYTVTFPDVSNLSDKDMQLLKEVILSVNKTGNSVLAYQAAEKIKHTLSIQTSLEPIHFLHVLMSDYNYITSRM